MSITCFKSCVTQVARHLHIWLDNDRALWNRYMIVDALVESCENCLRCLDDRFDMVSAFSFMTR